MGSLFRRPDQRDLVVAQSFSEFMMSVWMRSPCMVIKTFVCKRNALPENGTNEVNSEESYSIFCSEGESRIQRRGAEYKLGGRLIFSRPKWN